VNTLKKIGLFYVFANLHVSLATGAMTYVTLLKYEQKGVRPAVFVFLATVISYNFIRLVRLKTIKSWMSDWLLENKTYILFLCGICTFLLFGLLAQLRLESILVLVPFFILTFFYSIPVFYTKRSLRFTPGIKLFVIAISWAGVTVFFPVVEAQQQMDMKLFLLFIQRVFIAMALTIPFDIRDLRYDNVDLKTLPQLLGEKKAKYLGGVFVLFFIVLEGYFSQFDILLIFPELIVASLLLIGLYLSNRNQNKWFASFWVEAIPIAWLLLLLI